MKKTFAIAALVASLLTRCSQTTSQSSDFNPLDISNSYIVVLKGSEASSLGVASGTATRALMRTLENRYQLSEPERTFTTALQGGVYRLDERQVEDLKNDPSIAIVEKNQIFKASDVQNNATWGIDRLDQASLPLNQQYTHSTGGTTVTAYILDSGITFGHPEFEGRATSGPDFVNNDNDSTDCLGHGTHVSGTIGGKTWGVKKDVRLIGVRVLDCNGSGTTGAIISGIDWVTRNHKKPAVANMSLGGGISTALDQAVANSIAAGVTYGLAAGNNNGDACQGSPGRVNTAITVGSTTNTDARSDFSNWGSCVSIFAPGSNITSTWLNNGTNTISGTSMATPHVVGVAARYLAANPNATPAQVKNALVSNAVANKITNPSNSPNRLLNTMFLDGTILPPGETPLSKDQPLSNQSDAAAGEKIYTLEVPASSQNLVITLTGGSGNADLFVKLGSKPTTTAFDCQSVNAGNDETCSVAAPAAGRYYVLVKATAAYSGVTIKGSFVNQGGGGDEPCTACEKFTGNLRGSGDVNYPPNGSFQARAGVHKYWLKSPPNGEFHMFLLMLTSQGWQQVAQSNNSTGFERLAFNGPAGQYGLGVFSRNGSGPYTMWRRLP